MLKRINFSLTQLEYVLAVHQFGHFAKAASACKVTQPTLSMQIQKLESDLEVVIFDRSKKPILLTEAGSKIMEQIQLILFEAKKFDALIRSTKGGTLKGEIILGVIPTVAPYVLPKLLVQLEKMYPEIEMTILELQTQHIIDHLYSDKIDVGLLAIPLKIANIVERSLFFEPFSILCRKDHELAQGQQSQKMKYENLKANDIWLLEEGHCLRHQVLDVCSLKNKLGKKRNYKFESGSLETLKSLVNSYGGYTLLPALATDRIGENTQLVQFERPIPAREVGLVQRREFYKKELIDALSKAILASLPENIRKGRQKDLDVLPVV